jgi:sulfoxide reductase catalytic subunit YedY
MHNRRQFLKMITGFVSGMGLLFSPLANGARDVLAKAKKIILPKGTRLDSLIGKHPANLDTRYLELTPLEELATMGLSDHHVALDKWRLEIGGHVQRPRTLTYNQIVQMPPIEKNVLLICPGVFAYHARWKGISVAKLLETAGVDSGATQVIFSGPAGRYKKTEQFPLKDILADKVFLAYSVNDNLLPKKHGFPLRVVAEAYYGGVWVKYVSRVTVNK